MVNNKTSASYTLWWTWASAGMSCHAALEEIGCPYELTFVDFNEPWPKGYEELNPNLKVPTLIDHTATAPLVIYQSAAILLHLADRHPEANLIPKFGTPERAHCYQWLSFLAESLQSEYFVYFYPERHTANANVEPVKQKSIETINVLWGRIDNALMETNYVAGHDLSICDLYLLPLIHWTRDNDFNPLSAYKNLSGLVDRLYERESVQAMLLAHTEAE